jgi:hypothetical protein
VEVEGKDKYITRLYIKRKEVPALKVAGNVKCLSR